MIDRLSVLAADRTHLWHPYTPMDQWRANHRPLLVTSAQGPYLTLENGDRLIDANASWWVASLGHNHPRLLAALSAQAKTLSHVALAGITHEPAAMLAKELAEVAPKGLSQVFFTDDGSTAIEAAAKMALQFFAQSPAGKKKTRLLALEGAFHGETLGCVGLGGVEVFRRPFASVVMDCLRVPFPGDFQQAFAQLEQMVSQSADCLAAIVLEPLVQGAAGMRMYPPQYLAALVSLCRRHEVLVIADEVFVGYGRTGKMWACEHAGVSPDLLCVAKGFSGGLLPMGAVLTTPDVLKGFSGERSRAFLHGHSYCGNPLGAAVAREVLRVYRDEQIIEGTRLRAQRIADRFAAIAAGPLGSLIADVRCLGMIGALQLRASRAQIATVVPYETEADAAQGASRYEAEAGWRVYEEALLRGAYMRPLGNVVYVTPPLNIELPVLDRLLDIVEQSLATLVRSQP